MMSRMDDDNDDECHSKDIIIILSVGGRGQAREIPLNRYCA